MFNNEEQNGILEIIKEINWEIISTINRGDYIEIQTKRKNNNDEDIKHLQFNLRQKYKLINKYVIVDNCGNIMQITPRRISKAVL